MDWFQSVIDWFETVGHGFYLNFIKDDRWMYMVNGLLVTLAVTAGALVLGIFIGFIVAIIRSTYEKTGRLKFLDGICRVYLTVIRGTPILVQLMIIYFLVFYGIRVNQIMVAIIAFGINSGAYVAEIFRSGVIGIDAGQFEAGRSLGFSYTKTMLHIIMPQAARNVLPALVNEMISLLKETSIMGYIALQDVTRGAFVIYGQTYDPFFPLIILALFYLSVVMILSMFARRLERRLRRIER